MTLYARQDQAGRYVVCGMVDCGTRLARIVVGPEYEHLFTADETPRRAVAFGPGWYPAPPTAQRRKGADDAFYGLTAPWMLSARNRRRARFRTDEPAAASRQAPRARRDVRGEGDVGLAPFSLAVEARCPACAQRQVLDPARLDVSPRRGWRPGARRTAQGIVRAAPSAPGTAVSWPADW